MAEHICTEGGEEDGEICIAKQKIIKTCPESGEADDEEKCAFLCFFLDAT
jgi:hypothetical protein